MRKQWKVVVSAVLVLLVIIFAVMNTAKVTLDFGVATFYVPLIYIILGSAFVGAVVIFLLWLTSNLRQKKIIKQLTREYEELQENFEERVEKEIHHYQHDVENELELKDRRIRELEREFAELTGSAFNIETKENDE
ncbi:LapA family protein [Vagococcus elongatus]|uniref:Lipopolysaccharide assembly protein A domain-containing protein n=1 Tax=Vagococcus elongatus TaxID=180344 RepID=A0A430B5V5_9ENTE|nr:LapA family protein [Vagococcus elongatus]RSU15690.1 hypothetical protein CBF29_01040 [Vagococcus elongatus]